MRNYTFGDLIVRYRTMNVYAVLSPMGFDSFGLPAENAAIKTGRHPREFTDERIELLRSSILRIGAVYDWRRQVTSHSPEYQKWTQWIFLRFLDAGLAYRRNAPVNWCPGCQTVLANEQVDSDGRCDRSGDVVGTRDLEQWFLRITDYAQQLLDDLDALDWPERVKTMQRNWIGRSEGAEFSMPVTDADGVERDDRLSITVFTTRPDTSFGMTYAVMAPEHPLVPALVADDRLQLSRRLRESLQRSPREVFIDQIRVTPFFWERTARQIERYGMAEIYAFSTDFPHPEGGTDPIDKMAADITPLGDEALEAFFVRNAELLLPA